MSEAIFVLADSGLVDFERIRCASVGCSIIRVHRVDEASGEDQMAREIVRLMASGPARIVIDRSPVQGGPLEVLFEACAAGGVTRLARLRDFPGADNEALIFGAPSGAIQQE